MRNSYPETRKRRRKALVSKQLRLQRGKVHKWEVFENFGKRKSYRKAWHSDFTF